MRNISIFVTLSCLLCSPLYAHEPVRQQVVESIEINAPVDEVWGFVGDFSGLHKWHPAVQSTEMRGDDIRILSLAADKLITEKLIQHDEANKRLRYKIIDMSVTDTFEFGGSTVERTVLPVSIYTGLLSVVGRGTGSKVTWKGQFYRPYLLAPNFPAGMSDKDAVDAMSGVYKGGLENLKEMLEEGATASAFTPVAPVSPVSPVGSDEPVAAVAPVAPVAPVVVKTKGSFDSSNPYNGHVLCEIAKPCKIDRFLLKGFRAFSQCQVCHGIDGNGSTIAPSLIAKLKTEITYDIFVDRVTNGFQGQMGVMPPWKTNPNIMKNMDNLYAYLKARSDGILPAGRLERF